MAITQAAWGIDVGRCALKAIKVRIGAEGKVEVLAHDFVEHATILSQPDADRQELIANALEKFLSRNDLSKDRVVISVPGQHTLARFTKLPPVSAKRIPDIVRYEADQQIPFDMDEVIWDYQTFEQEDLPDVEVGIFAMKRELLREHLLHFEQAAIEPIAVQCAPLAVYNAAQYDGLLGSETTVLLDIGADNADLIIATPGSLWTRTIQLGGNRFTEALMKSFKLSFAKAESLKRTAESSKYRRQVFQAMRPIFADIVQELQRSMGFYSSTHRDAQIDKVVGVGNAFKLPGLQKYLEQNLGITVEVPKAFQNIVPSPAASAGALTDDFLSFAVAYGLALQGLELTAITSNLLPVEIAKQVVWRKKRPAFAAAAACLVLAGGAIWFRQITDMGALAAGAEEMDRVQVNIDQAPGIIDNGPSSSLSPWGQAAMVKEAAKVLKSRLQQLTNEGQDEREDTESLIAAQRNKGIVPQILQAIHESVPTDPGALGQAQTQTELLAAIAAGAPPRAKRQRVSIRSVNMEYFADLNELELGESLIEAGYRINDSGDPLPGFGIRIICRLPNDGGPKYVGDTFMTTLRENGRRPNAGFYFDRVWLLAGGKVSGSGSPAGGAGWGGTESKSEENRDPVTNEPTNDDWEFEIWVDAILEDLPESELEEESAEEEEED